MSTAFQREVDMRLIVPETEQMHYAIQLDSALSKIELLNSQYC